MRLSIAMCTYNGASYLNAQLSSFAHQQRLPDELVVCDDQSTDATVWLLEQFALRAPFSVRIVRNPVNLGYRRNFRQALETCQGDAIALADQDDIWYPQKLARMEQILVRQPTLEGVFSDGDVIDEQSANTGRTLWQSFNFDTAAQARFRYGGALGELLRRNVVTGMAFMLRSSARDLLQDMPDSWIHDGWVAFLLALRSSLYACPERLVAYRVHEKQAVGTPLSVTGKLQALQDHGLRAYSQTVRAKNLKEYQRTAIQFSDLLAFLRQRSLGTGEIQAAVQQKQEHAARGAAVLSTDYLKRIPMVLGHLGSYRRYSPIGLRAAARDLLI